MRYERKVHEHLALLALARPNLEYLQSPWIEFLDSSGKRYCQPDALLVDYGQLAAVIYEIKYQHTPSAWWQLVHLYQPVVRVLFPRLKTTALVEIVHWHDPAVQFPERYDLTDNPLKVPHANTVAVHIFNPRRAQSRMAADGGNVSEGSRQAVGAIPDAAGAK